MSRKLYEEALADVRQIKDVAEANAQRAILEAVAPRIRKMIEDQLLGEAPPDEDDPEKLLTDLVDPSVASDVEEPAGAVSMPDEEGKVTLDLDALVADEAGAAVEPPVFGEPQPAAVGGGGEFALSAESVGVLAPILNAAKKGSSKDVVHSVKKIGEMVSTFTEASGKLKGSQGFQEKIAQMISGVENMYDYVQEALGDSGTKKLCEEKLEGYFEQLNELREQTMAKKNLRDMLNEEEVTVKLTGLPDETDVDDLGVDLISDEGEEGEEGGEELDLDVGDEEGEEGEEGGEEDLGGDLDLGDLGGDEGEGEEGGDEDELDLESVLNLPDDTIVEIDTRMLAREIKKMRKLNEQSMNDAPPPSSDGAGADDAAVLDDFGGGSDDGEPMVDGEVTTGGFEPLGESDINEDDLVGEGEGCEEGEEPTMEGLKRRLSRERRVQKAARSKGAQLKREHAKARKVGASSRRLASIRRAYGVQLRKFNESVSRANRIKRSLNEATRARSNSGSRGKERLLSKKLSEANLNNVKLQYANKLLQVQSIPSSKKVKILEQLDKVRTAREAKLVYESAVKLTGRTSLREGAAGRRVIGSGSRPTRSAGKQITEGAELSRWSKLAGITK
jgi:hypothetical protein